MAPATRREKTLTPKSSAMKSYVKLMRHPQHWYFPQFRCNMPKISAKRYRRAKLNPWLCSSGLTDELVTGIEHIHVTYLYTIKAGIHRMLKVTGHY